MRRRDLLKTGMAGLMLSPMLREMRAKADQVSSSSPFALVETSGDQALTAWARLKGAGRGAPVVLGDPGIATGLVNASDPDTYHKAVSETLERASRLRFPKDFPLAKIRSDVPPSADATEQIGEQPPVVTIFEIYRAGNPKTAEPPSRQALDEALAADERKLRDVEAAMLRNGKNPEVGRWPSKAASAPGLTVIHDGFTRTPLAKISIALIPTSDWTTIPAHLQWGGWNDCPAPEWHVAALRSWRDRFGAELIGIGRNVMNVRVARRPPTRHSALALAHEQFSYCPYIAFQGVQTLSARAAELMANDWWFFSWD